MSLIIIFKNLRARRFHITLAKFLLSGGLAAATEYASFLVLVSIHLPVVPANITSFCLGLIVSFSLNKSWVFLADGKTRSQFIKYAILALVNLCISTTSVWFLTTHMGVSAGVAKISMMVLIAAWNFVIFSRFVFIKNEA